MGTVNVRNVLGLLARHYRVETMQTTEPNSKEQQLMELLKGMIEEFQNQSLCDASFTTTVVYDPEILPAISSNNSDPVDERSASPHSSASSEGSSAEYKPEKPEREYVRIPLEYKKNAVHYWENGGKTKKLSLQTVHGRYTRVTSLTQLYKWKRDFEKADTNGK